MWRLRRRSAILIQVKDGRTSRTSPAPRGERALPDVFEALDYRAFLRAAYEVLQGRRLSHRWHARRAGIRSPSFLGHVMDGKRNLAPGTAARVAQALGLAGDAAEYFSALVLFNQARETAERRTAYARLSRYRRFRDVQPLEAARDAYFSKWYLPAIRELATLPEFRAEPSWLAATLRPHISAREARAALRTLEVLGLLRRDGARLVAAATHVTTEAETASTHVAAFHRAMMQRASASIDEDPPGERDISSITLCIGDEGVAALKRRIQDLRRDLLDEFGAEGRGVRVVQLNFQMFPLSERVSGGRR